MISLSCQRCKGSANWAFKNLPVKCSPWWNRWHGSTCFPRQVCLARGSVMKISPIFGTIHCLTQRETMRFSDECDELRSGVAQVPQWCPEYVSKCNLCLSLEYHTQCWRISPIEDYLAVVDPGLWSNSCPIHLEKDLEMWLYDSIILFLCLLAISVWYWKEGGAVR